MTELRSDRLSAEDEQHAIEWLHEHRRTDGLPVVVPTAARVETLLAAVDDDASVVLGTIGPAMGVATVEKVAINAVMAGCRPEHLPIVIAAVRAVCDPTLDTTEAQSTTHCIAPLLIVNGPAARAAGLASGFGVLGYGHRANLSIGRALRLCLVNIGGGFPEISDLALHGHPGSIAYCLAEDEESSPLPPLHTARGYATDASTVTVANVEAPHSVLVLPESGDPSLPDRILAALAASLSALGSNNTHSGQGTVVVVLNPDHASALTASGHDRASIQREIATRSGARVEDLLAVVPPSLRVRFDGRSSSERVPSIRDPEQVLVVVAGGPGLYSMVMPSWGAGPHSNTAVTVPVASWSSRSTEA
jgi:hypothetical protein